MGLLATGWLMMFSGTNTTYWSPGKFVERQIVRHCQPIRVKFILILIISKSWFQSQVAIPNFSGYRNRLHQLMRSQGDILWVRDPKIDDKKYHQRPFVSQVNECIGLAEFNSASRLCVFTLTGCFILRNKVEQFLGHRNTMAFSAWEH